jgi:hypothetical protein
MGVRTIRFLDAPRTLATASLTGEVDRMYSIRPAEVWEFEEVRKKLESEDELDDRELWIASQMDLGCFEEGD